MSSPSHALKTFTVQLMETGGRGSDGHHAHHHVGAGQGGGKDVVTTLHQHMAVKIVQGREKEHKNVMRILVQLTGIGVSGLSFLCVVPRVGSVQW